MKILNIAHSNAQAHIRAIIVCFLFLFVPVLSQAQDTLREAPHAHQHLALLASPRPDSILLRWAPASVEAWRLGNRYGYMLQRHTIIRDGELCNEHDSVTLTLQPLIPLPVEQWEPWAENKYVGIAAECIFGHDSTPVGGNPHLIARRYREEQNRFGFALYAADQSLLVARLSGLYFADLTAKANEKYLYRVFIPIPANDTSAAPLDTAIAFTGISEYQPLPPPLDLRARWDDHKVELSWDILYLSHIYNSYIVEKGDDSLSFAPLGENATVQLTDNDVTPRRAYRSDSLENNAATYYYRVRGISAFGEIGPPTKYIAGTGRLPITQAPTVTGNEVVDNRKVLLTWAYPEEMNRYISGFKVYRSDKPSGVKRLLHSGSDPASRSFADVNPALTNYYLVSVYDGHNEKLSPAFTYAELVDSIPPSPPVSLAGKIDSTGRVFLLWAHNKEADIDGYRIYRANRPNADFQLLYPSVINDTVFVDSINIKTLDAKIYYKLRAVDLRQNHSEFTDALELERPDVIPPVTPVLQKVAAGKRGIDISWINSTSTDVAWHIVMRQAEGDADYSRVVAIGKVNKGTTYEYTDVNVKPDKVYRYRVVAQDVHGLNSAFSRPMQAKAVAGIKEDVRLKAQKLFDKATLTWTVTSEKTVVRVLVYRSIDDSPLRLLGNSTGTDFTDSGLAIDKRYSYRIKAVFADETTSGLSNEVSIDN